MSTADDRVRATKSTEAAVCPTFGSNATGMDFIADVALAPEPFSVAAGLDSRSISRSVVARSALGFNATRTTMRTTIETMRGFEVIAK